MASEVLLRIRVFTQSWANPLELVQLNGDYGSLTKRTERDGSALIMSTSSLAAIGAGGNVYAQSFSVAEKQLDESKKHTKSLDKIAENAEILTQKQMGNGNLLMR